jgi:hypothetical protein
MGEMKFGTKPKPYKRIRDKTKEKKYMIRAKFYKMVESMTKSKN